MALSLGLAGLGVIFAKRVERRAARAGGGARQERRAEIDRVSRAKRQGRRARSDMSKKRIIQA